MCRTYYVGLYGRMQKYVLSLSGKTSGKEIFREARCKEE